MKRTSKLLAMLLAILMVLSLMVACGDTPAETTPESTTAAPETTKTPPETTKAPATTEAPATEAPTTEAPETEAPATEAPTTEAPVGEEPNVTEVPDVTEAPEESEEIGETEEIEETEETEEDEDPDDPIETEPVETEPVETEPVETEPAETEPEEEIGDLEALLPEKIELGLEMSILVEELYYAEWLDEDDGDIVGTELYSRVPRVSSRLGIELDVQRIAINHEGFVDETEKRHESSDPNLVVALASGYSQMVGRLAVDGRFHNIANSDNVNFDSPWWPKDLLINSTIDDKVYFVSGDISPTLIYETYAIFFNRELIERHNIEDPISLVLNYKWTIDKLIEVTSGIYEDLDKEKAGPSLGDFFAFNFNDDAHYKPLPFAMGISG